MTLRLHDTLSGETRPFVPLRDDRVGVYSCGPTVYGPAHIGNFRSFLFADLLVRHLRWRGYAVTWVMNITDIDDKIIRGAAATGEDIGTAGGTLSRDVPGGRRGAPDDDAGRPAARDPAHRRDRRADRDAARARPRLPDRGRLDLLQDRVVAGVRAPGATRPRGAAGRGAGRGRRIRQGRRPRLRPVEGSQARRAGLADRHRPGPARLAHRVLGDEHGPPRAVVRPPHRRCRPHLPAPRGRDRPERGGDRPDLRRDVAALRPPAGVRHEDGQVDRQHRAGRRGPCDGLSRRGRCGWRSSRSTTVPASTTRPTRWRRPRRPWTGSTRPSRHSARTSRAGRTTRDPRNASRRPGRISARRSTTTSTCRPVWPWCSTSSAT